QGGERGRRVVVARVLAGVLRVAVRRHRLLVGPPRLTLAEDAGRGGRAAGQRAAVAGEPGQRRVSEPRGGADVVRQALVGDVVVVGGQPALRGQRVQVGRLG